MTCDCLDKLEKISFSYSNRFILVTKNVFSLLRCKLAIDAHLRLNLHFYHYQIFNKTNYAHSYIQLPLSVSWYVNWLNYWFPRSTIVRECVCYIVCVCVPEFNKLFDISPSITTIQILVLEVAKLVYC